MEAFEKITEQKFEGNICVTDPCYDKNIWCRVNDLDILPGIYNCYAAKNESEVRIAACAIVHKDYEHLVWSDNWAYGNNIGVDAGCAGFFENKPDFDHDAWKEICKYMRERRAQNQETFFLENEDWHGFWTESGYGDGGYDFYKLEKNGKIVALKIVFIPDKDEYDDEDDYM